MQNKIISIAEIKGKQERMITTFGFSLGLAT